MTTYVVSTTGNNANDGGILTPFATFAYAQSVASNGDTIYLRGGTYTDYTPITKSLMLSAYETEPTVLQPTAGIEGAALLISTSNVTVDKLTVDAVNRKRGIDISTAANVTLSNGEVKNCYGVGEGQYGQGIVVSQDETCRDVLITDMLIHHVGSTASDTLAKCHGIYAACPGMHIRRTEIHTVDSHAVHWYGSQGGDLTLEDCYIHDVRIGAGFYNSSVVAYNNVIRDVLSAFWTRDNLISALVAYNTCTDFASAVSIASLKNNDPVVSVAYVNNVFHNGTRLLHAEQLTITTATVDMSHNLRSAVTDEDYFGAYASAYQVEHIGATFAPITDDGAVDIRPLASNPAIGAGVLVPGMPLDKDNQRRPTDPTLGAYEFAPVRVVVMQSGIMRTTRSVYRTRG